MAKKPKSRTLNQARRMQAGQKKKQALIKQLMAGDTVRPILKALPCVPVSDLVKTARKTMTDLVPGTSPCLFFSYTDGTKRAEVIHIAGKPIQEVWLELDRILKQRHGKKNAAARWLRIDWVTDVQKRTWGELNIRLARHKRNYFRCGIALDPDFRFAFLEQELNANAMLYSGNDISYAQVNRKNFMRYARQRFGSDIQVDFHPDAAVTTFATDAVLIEPEQAPRHLYGFFGGAEGRDTGRRQIDALDRDTVYQLIDHAGQFLAEQVKADGRFVYGMFPCFDQEIKHYNTLRHASTTYSMLESWETTREDRLKQSIDRALSCIADKLVRTYTLPTGEQVAYLVDTGDEIKLGGNAVCILAMVKYTELTGDDRYLALMTLLAKGICRLQDPVTGRMTHVINANDLSVREQTRIVYYDGEAAFGLMRLYGLTRDARWLAVVEKAFEHFIARKHWEWHDHWLSYCVNELTRYRPEEKYYWFGIRNVAGYLDFVQDRITPFPTLLELMMAAHKMIRRLARQPEMRHLLDHLDLEKFYRALEHRARYLLNGYFWPEFAMFFQNPQRILGSFFIRHHGFRVRIDDVEHYLSGYVAYLNHYLDGPAPGKIRNLPPAEPETARLPADIPGSAVRVVWGGDVNLGRRQHYRTQQLGVGRVLDLPALRQADLGIVNLESVVAVCGEQGVPKGEGGPYYYRARPEMLEVLVHAGVDAVTTANNHSGDYGPEAVLQQAGFLDAVGIAHTGTGPNLDRALAPAICRAGHLTVALFSLDATQPRFGAGPDRPGSAYLSLSRPSHWHTLLAPRIQAARQHADVVLVAVHWGANLATEPDEMEIAVGHAVIDAGADAVLGTSAHRLQGIEVYQNRPVIHDAGDLLFDSVRPDFSPGALFELEMDAEGVTAVNIVPVGVGFGFTRQLRGESGANIGRQMQMLSEPLGAVDWEVRDHQYRLRLAPPQRLSTGPTHPSGPEPRAVGPLLNILRQQYQQLPCPGAASAVPDNAVIDPVRMGGITLLGIRVSPHHLTTRTMLWVETWWRMDQALVCDLRLDYRAVPVNEGKMPVWGKEMDHDPCDWLCPTSRWEPGTVYRDFYGVRPPAAKLLENGPLRIEVRVLGPDRASEPYCWPKEIDLDLAGQRPVHYRTQFSDIIYRCRPGQTWTAEQLAAVTQGQWRVPPPDGWFVRSVVNGKKYVSMRPDPLLFVAHTNLDRARHENSRKPPKNIDDRHLLLPRIIKDLAGAIIAKPVSGLPDNFPLLLVDDPIQAHMELGLAARQRFSGPVIAVTGTAGKTSTLNLMETLFDEGKYLCSLDNYNSRVGVPVQLACLGMDHQAAILEIAQSALWMKRGPITRLVRPTISIITEIGISQPDHNIRTTMDVAQWKSRIFDGLVPEGTAIFGEHLLHFDYVMAQAEEFAGRIITFGKNPQATLRILEEHVDETGTHLILAIGKTLISLDVPFNNPGMLHNALAVLCTAYALGKDLQETARNFSRYKAEDGRLDQYTIQLPTGNVDVIDDSWNAETISMLNAFSVLKSMPAKNRKVSVLGRIVHLGELAEQLHASLAKPLLGTGVSLVVTHGDEMRFLRKQMPEDLLGPHFDTAPDVCAWLERHLASGDLMLLKGSRRDSDFKDISTWLKERIAK